MDYIQEYNLFIDEIISKPSDNGLLLIFCDFLDEYEYKEEFKYLFFKERSEFIRGYCSNFYDFENITDIIITSDIDGYKYGEISFYDKTKVSFDLFLIKSVFCYTKNENYIKYNGILRNQLRKIE